MDGRDWIEVDRGNFRPLIDRTELDLPFPKDLHSLRARLSEIMMMTSFSGYMNVEIKIYKVQEVKQYIRR